MEMMTAKSDKIVRTRVGKKPVFLREEKNGDGLERMKKFTKKEKTNEEVTRGHSIVADGWVGASNP